MTNYDQKEEALPICGQIEDVQEAGGENLGLIRGQGEKAQGQEAQTIINTPSVPVMKTPKKREKTSSKLIVSAEVSRGIWDSCQDAISDGRYTSMSDLVRRAVARELNKPVRLR